VSDAAHDWAAVVLGLLLLASSFQLYRRALRSEYPRI